MGRITATAIGADTKFQSVEPRHWAHLDFDPNAKAHLRIFDGTPQLSDVRLLRVEIQSQWPGPDEAAAEATRMVPKGKPGRKAKYDKELFIAEAIRFIDYHGGLSPADDPQFTRATVAKHMASWCINRWEDDGPEETWRKKHLRLAIERYEADQNA